MTAASAKPPDGLLWHYTDAFGFHGITNDGSIRATHISFLNDRTEGVHAGELIKSLALRMLFGRLTRQQSLWFHSLAGRRLDAFVVAMTEAYDRLDSWRGYANGGLGYSLGFAPSVLRRLPRAQLRKCVYIDPDVTVDNPLPLLGTPPELSFLLTHHVTAPEDEELSKEQFFIKADQALARYGPELKHYAFHEEREHRLVLTGVAPSDVLLSPSRSGRLIPRVSIELEMEALQAICLGPGLDDSDEYAAKLHLDSNLYGHVQIFRSTVPLRAV
jgi:hypothetical protein